MSCQETNSRRASPLHLLIWAVVSQAAQLTPTAIRARRRVQLVKLPCPCPLQFLFGRFEPLCVRAERSSAGHLICRWHLTADSEGCLLPSACRESETPPVCLLLMRGLVPLPRLPLPPFRSPSSAPPAWLGHRSLLAPWGWADGWCCWDRKGWTRCLLDGWISNLSVHPFLSSLCVAALQV